MIYICTRSRQAEVEKDEQQREVRGERQRVRPIVPPQPQLFSGARVDQVGVELTRMGSTSDAASLSTDLGRTWANAHELWLALAGERCKSREH
jgi:hypothetical protein